MGVDQLSWKPDHLIGAATGFSLAAFKSMYESMEKTAGKAPDTVVCGSKAVAEDAWNAAERLGYPLAVIVDEEISPRRFYLMSASDLGDFPGGGQN